MSKRIAKKTAPGADYGRAEATALAARIVAAQIERETLVATRDAAMTHAAQPYRADIDAIDAELADGLARLEAWATAHPEEFGDAGSTILAGGHRVGWRLGQWTAKTLRGWTWAKIVEHLQSLPKGWRDAYLRIKTEPDKAAIIRDRDKVQWDEMGIQFEQARRFYLEPGREDDV